MELVVGGGKLAMGTGTGGISLCDVGPLTQSLSCFSKGATKYSVIIGREAAFLVCMYHTVHAKCDDCQGHARKS